MPGSIQASTACERPAIEPSIAATCDRMIREQIPNLFRPHLNPFVAQACYCLTRLVAEACPASLDPDELQVFLCNSGEEALSGAIKLARYAANVQGLSNRGLILDEEGQFEHFAFTDLSGLGRLEFIPGIEVATEQRELSARLEAARPATGFVVVAQKSLPVVAGCLRDSFAAPRPLLIVCADQGGLAGREHRPAEGPAPDITVFDESFVNREVPFGAFVATRQLYGHWNRRGMTTFHSTTYQPNTISTLHLVNCLRQSAPAFVARHRDALERIEEDPKFRRKVFRDLYSRSLAKLTAAAGLHNGPVRAAGHYVSVAGRRIFDGVAGVACSIRGHNPSTYLQEIEQSGDLESCRGELTERLTQLTGLARMVPAVSGASAVEHALKLGLASQSPRDWVLALRGGFGGKTLVALTGTWKASLKAGLDPLYPKVVYVDPFADDALPALDAAFRDHPIGLVQLELIQGVGGVRAIPSSVLQRLVALRREHDCLLFVDEVQTGMYRTGPFVRSQELRLEPDLLTIGKGTSDMMFPFAMTLYSDPVGDGLEARRSPLPEAIHARYDYHTGLRTVLNVLRQAEEHNLPDRVRGQSTLFARLLRDELATCPLVREVRCFGLLIGIELNDRVGPQRWLGKLAHQLRLLAMLHDRRFPLLIGFCQYEPNVLKLTPPLSVAEHEVRSICATISSVLHRSLGRVVVSGLRRMTLSVLQAVGPHFSQEVKP